MKIFVKTKPNSKENRLEKINDFDYCAFVTAPPRHGKANDAVCRLLAAYFKISRSRIRLILGKTSKEKLFEIILGR